MARMVKCVKLGRELPGLDFAPIKGELGERIYNQVSQEAWEMWIKHQTMVINEYRLNPSEPEGQNILRSQLESFFWGEGAEAPPEYVPPTSKD